MPLADALRIVATWLRRSTTLIGSGFVHRDVKPENVLFAVGLEAFHPPPRGQAL